MKLEIGTAEPVVEEKKKLKKRPTLTSGGGSPGGSNGGGRNRGGGGDNLGGSGGGHRADGQNFGQVEEEYKPAKLRIVMWFLLLVVLMTFGGLVAAYIVISTNGVAEWQPFDLPRQIWLSTILILAASVTYQIADSKLKRGEQTSAKKWLAATTVVGATFISSQLLAWLVLVQKGVYVRSNPYAGFFYILTAVHAVHVLGGILTLGYIVLRTWRETGSETELLRRQTMASVVGWYWHFMGGLWIVLFLLLGFWK